MGSVLISCALPDVVLTLSITEVLLRLHPAFQHVALFLILFPVLALEKHCMNSCGGQVVKLTQNYCLSLMRHPWYAISR